MRTAFLEEECDYNISLRFRLDNLQSYFEPDALQVDDVLTETFGPGWHIRCERMDVDGKAYLSCFLVVGSTRYPEPITWTFVGTSIEGGVNYFNLSTTHLFEQEDAWGWVECLSMSDWESFDGLRRDNALLVKATIRARVAPVQVGRPDKWLAVSQKAITSGRSCDIQFMANSTRRSQSGQPSNPRRLFAHEEVIEMTCPRLAACLQCPDKAGTLAIVPALFGHDSKYPSLAHSRMAAPDDVGSDSDIESDFEDDEDEQPDPPSVSDGVNDASDTVNKTNAHVDEEAGDAPHSVQDLSPMADAEADISVHRTIGLATNDVGRNDGDASDTDSWEGKLSPLDDEWTLEERMTAVEAARPRITSNASKEASKTYPSLEWISGVGLSDMDDAISSNIHTGSARESDLKCSVPPDALVQAQENTNVHSHHIPPCTPEPIIRIITVTGAASSTWESFLFYLYTDVITFAPLRSRGNATRKKWLADYKAEHPYQPVPCSCKSIYRLAHRLDMADLKALALEELTSQLSQDNIVAEIFTNFVSQHEEVKEMEVRVLKEHWGNLKGTMKVSEMLQKVVRCNLPHATAIMGALW